MTHEGEAQTDEYLNHNNFRNLAIQRNLTFEESNARILKIAKLIVSLSTGQIT